MVACRQQSLISGQPVTGANCLCMVSLFWFWLRTEGEKVNRKEDNCWVKGTSVEHPVALWHLVLAVISYTGPVGRAVYSCRWKGRGRGPFGAWQVQRENGVRSFGESKPEPRPNDGVSSLWGQVLYLTSGSPKTQTKSSFCRIDNQHRQLINIKYWLQCILKNQTCRLQFILDCTWVKVGLWYV